MFWYGHLSSPLPSATIPNAYPTMQENGIFAALKEKVLVALQLTVITDTECPTNVLESYTFSFNYTGGPNDASSRLASLSIDPVDYAADLGSVHSAMTDTEMIVRRLISLSAYMPNLPGTSPRSCSLNIGCSS